MQSSVSLIRYCKVTAAAWIGGHYFFSHIRAGGIGGLLHTAGHLATAASVDATSVDEAEGSVTSPCWDPCTPTTRRGGDLCVACLALRECSDADTGSAAMWRGWEVRQAPAAVRRVVRIRGGRRGGIPRPRYGGERGGAPPSPHGAVRRRAVGTVRHMHQRGRRRGRHRGGQQREALPVSPGAVAHAAWRGAAVGAPTGCAARDSGAERNGQRGELWGERRRGGRRVIGALTRP